MLMVLVRVKEWSLEIITFLKLGLKLIAPMLEAIMFLNKNHLPILVAKFRTIAEQEFMQKYLKVHCFFIIISENQKLKIIAAYITHLMFQEMKTLNRISIRKMQFFYLKLYKNFIQSQLDKKSDSLIISQSLNFNNIYII